MSVWTLNNRLRQFTETSHTHMRTGGTEWLAAHRSSTLPVFPPQLCLSPLLPGGNF